MVINLKYVTLIFYIRIICIFSFSVFFLILFYQSFQVPYTKSYCGISFCVCTVWYRVHTKWYTTIGFSIQIKILLSVIVCSYRPKYTIINEEECICIIYSLQENEWFRATLPVSKASQGMLTKLFFDKYICKVW